MCHDTGSSPATEVQERDEHFVGGEEASLFASNGILVDKTDSLWTETTSISSQQIADNIHFTIPCHTGLAGANISCSAMAVSVSVLILNSRQQATGLDKQCHLQPLYAASKASFPNNRGSCKSAKDQFALESGENLFWSSSLRQIGPLHSDIACVEAVVAHSHERMYEV